MDDDGSGVAHEIVEGPDDLDIVPGAAQRGRHTGVKVALQLRISPSFDRMVVVLPMPLRWLIT